MPTEFARERLSVLMAGFAGRRILVIGDLMLDEYVWGKVSRISPEAPVPIVNVTGETYYPGGAANVARNLREFTEGAAVMGLIGNDAPGRRLRGLLEDGAIDTSAILQEDGCTTAIKSRIIARNQQVVRVDRERIAPLTPAHEQLVIDRVEHAIDSLDAIIVADYGKGFLSQTLADHLCRTARVHRKLLAVDPHPRTSLDWHGASAIKPNRAEAFLAAQVPSADPVVPVLEDHALLEAGRRLLERWQPGCLLITLGEHGMLLFTPDEPPYHTPTHAQDVFDVSGAGDTAIAVFTLALASGGTPAEAAELANRASGLVVGKLGTATATLSEMQESLAQ